MGCSAVRRSAEGNRKSEKSDLEIKDTGEGEMEEVGVELGWGRDGGVRGVGMHGRGERGQGSGKDAVGRVTLY
jgi:hypothetical protein